MAMMILVTNHTMKVAMYLFLFICNFLGQHCPFEQREKGGCVQRVSGCVCINMDSRTLLMDQYWKWQLD